MKLLAETTSATGRPPLFSSNYLGNYICRVKQYKGQVLDNTAAGEGERERVRMVGWCGGRGSNN